MAKEIKVSEHVVTGGAGWQRVKPGAEYEAVVLFYSGGRVSFNVAISSGRLANCTHVNLRFRRVGKKLSIEPLAYGSMIDPDSFPVYRDSGSGAYLDNSAIPSVIRSLGVEFPGPDLPLRCPAIWMEDYRAFLVPLVGREVSFGDDDFRLGDEASDKG